jgi:hypothetical protein
VNVKKLFPASEITIGVPPALAVSKKVKICQKSTLYVYSFKNFNSLLVHVLISQNNSLGYAGPRNITHPL